MFLQSEGANQGTKVQETQETEDVIQEGGVEGKEMPEASCASAEGNLSRPKGVDGSWGDFSKR